MSKKSSFNFGFAIKAIREAKKISIRDLATLSKVSPSTISSVENERRDLSIATAIKIAEGLGVSFEELTKLAKNLVEDKEAITRNKDSLNLKVLGALNNGKSN